MQKLRDLSADNSKGDLCIEKFLIKSEKAFFEEVKREKISGELLEPFVEGRGAHCSDVDPLFARFVHAVPRTFHGRWLPSRM